jgi:hypothetical protein
MISINSENYPQLVETGSFYTLKITDPKTCGEPGSSPDTVDYGDDLLTESAL